MSVFPESANYGVAHGYPDARNERSDLYHDLISTYACRAEDLKVDLSRIYLTSLGSGARIAGGLAMDHPRSYAAAASAWYLPIQSCVHPLLPGNWRIYNNDRRYGNDAFAKSVVAGGGDCSFLFVDPEAAHSWWNAVWSGGEVWAWLFSKSAPEFVRSRL